MCSGRFARAVCKKIGELYEEQSDRSLKDLLYKSAEEAFPLGGSTTVVMTRLVENGGDTRLETLNLGDSAYMILRPEVDG